MPATRQPRSSLLTNIYSWPIFGFIIVVLFLCLPTVSGTPFYYGTYRSYGTGDTVITTSHANGGPDTPHSKWQVECLDGEAAIGILDNVFDFGGITQLWCKFMFPYKISTRNVYPYFPHCIVKNYTVDFFCYDPRNHTRSANTFITGLWDNELSFWVYRTAIDPSQPYKCCVTPPGYYIDYVSCYYVWTHDQYWEYYDSQFFLLNCATGYVMTGISKKLSPIIPTEYRIEWLQCCRLGYGAIVSLPPPIVATPKGGPVAYSANNALTAVDIPSDYAHQYRGKRSADRPTAQHTKRHTAFAREHPLPGDGPFMQSPFLDAGRHHEDTAHEADGTSNASKPSVSDKKITEQDKSPVLMESM